MSYEAQMLKNFNMPSRREVEEVLLKSLFNHNGIIKEFGEGEEIVDEIAFEFKLSEEQRNAFLETVYRKENRIKRSSLWHRLLFRAADSLAKEKLIIRPTQTFKLTNKREWMLTEDGFNKISNMLKIPSTQKEKLSTKSYEVQKIIKKLFEIRKPENYNPFDRDKKCVKTSREATIRTRGFRLAVIEAYDYRCSVCGMKLKSPNDQNWEVEAAHIVPHSALGKDDIWNGLALCRLHHWAFDVGWFTLSDDYVLHVSSKIKSIPNKFGMIGDFNFVSHLKDTYKIMLPNIENLFPHKSAIQWHRKNIFCE
jgi:hypothetical protein